MHLARTLTLALASGIACAEPGEDALGSASVLERFAAGRFDAGPVRLERARGSELLLERRSAAAESHTPERRADAGSSAIELDPGEGVEAALRLRAGQGLRVRFRGAAGARIGVLAVDEGTNEVLASEVRECAAEDLSLTLDGDGVADGRASWIVANLGEAPLRVGAIELVGPRTRPNVVLIVVDTLRADALIDPLGLVETPALDALVAESVAYPLALAHAPMTLPSHTALFSSRLPHEAGTVNNGEKVDPELPLVAAWLAEHGWRTEAVLALGTLWNDRPGTTVDRGFDAYAHGEENMAVAGEIVERTRAALDRLEGREPFFLFVHFSDPHEPYNAHASERNVASIRWNGEPLAEVATSNMTQRRIPLALAAGANELVLESEDPFLLRRLSIDGLPEGATEVREDEIVAGATRTGEDALARVRVTVTNPTGEPAEGSLQLWIHDAPGFEESQRRYGLEVEHVDAAVGRVVAELEKRGLWDGALVVFTSDHGEALGEHGLFGHVQNLYDELIRVPLLVKPPAGHPLRPALEARRARLARHVDVVPTMLEILGLPPLPGQRGSSLSSDAERVHIAETHRPEAERDLLCVRDERWKMVYDPTADRFEMYDLTTDGGELEDVFAMRRSERPEWPATLRALAERAAGRGERELDEKARKRLRELGYLGDAPADEPDGRD